jgi:hypothetical protein
MIVFSPDGLSYGSPDRAVGGVLFRVGFWLAWQAIRCSCCASQSGPARRLGQYKMQLELVPEVGHRPFPSSKIGDIMPVHELRKDYAGPENHLPPLPPSERQQPGLHQPRLRQTHVGLGPAIRSDA